MSDLVSDSAPRRKLSGVKPTSNNKQSVYLILSPVFFSRRGKQMEPLDEFSEEVYSNLVDGDKGSTYIILHKQEDLPSVVLQNLVKKDGLDMRFFEIDSAQVGDTISRLKNLLQSLGLRLCPMRNPRTVSPLNIQKFVQGDRLTTVKDDDYAIFGIAPDKELTFQDMVKKRKQSSWL